MVLAKHVRLKERLWTSESLAAHRDLATVWQRVVLVQCDVTVVDAREFVDVVRSDVTQLLLDILRNLSLCTGLQSNCALVQKLKNMTKTLKCAFTFSCIVRRE